MNVFAISHNDSRPQSGSFQANRDKPITSQPQLNENPFSASDPDQPGDTTSYIHAIHYLKTIDKLYIQQNVALLELLLDIETKNKYNVLDGLGQKVFLALEESGCCVRLLCGPLRNFEMHILDNLNNEVIRMVRHLGCIGCPFWLQKLEVFCPSDVLVGYVEHEFTLLHPRFGIYDKDGMKMLQVKGPICQCKCCKDVDYQITSTTGEFVGTISKQWMGFITEGFTDADTFRLEFPTDLDVNMKMVLMGAAFLIDYMYYEKAKNM